MHLYLVQHGDAVAKDMDPLRPLSDKGRKGVGQLASFLARSRFRVDRVLHSGKLRAQQTALIYADVLGPGRLVQDCAYPIGPNDAISPLTGALKSEFGSDDRVMIVGHLPYMGKLVSQLITGDETSGCVQFEPGCVIALERGEEMHNWTIQWVVRPSLFGG